jgi:hypothetical protein
MESGSLRPSVLAERLHIAARSATERFLAVLSERDRRTLDRILRVLVDR